MRFLLVILVATLLPAVTAQAQASPSSPVTVGEDGVMRWAASGEEVALFGVNYSTPFAYAYRAHERLGVPHEAAIDADVAHLARLGFDAFRVHVWDREVSDREGNLVENEHLRLLDYLIARLKERRIYTLLTPIAWWGPGWPELDPATTGFSTFHSKAAMATDPASRLAQKRYLAQFLDHVNPYTGLTYREDPDIIAIELFNEPAHLEPPEETTRYVDELVEVVRATGFEKPIFYNVSQNWSEEHAAAVAAADVQGVSFQWYPTGLVRNETLRGNYLPNVDHYPIPHERVEDFSRLARMVYEFDAADVAGAYMYPAMARSFREAGMQWATQFSYDPLSLAHANTEYGTHFLNLVYSPGRALSLMIAAEVFRSIPRGSTHPDYPRNARFGDFRVSYEEDLSEMTTRERMIYANTTQTLPPEPHSLRQIAGVGSSPVVHYDGTGAYFLDRLDDGVWRLEVYPDAIWIADPFGRTSPERPVSRLVWRTHTMTMELPDLGPDFHLGALDAGNTHSDAARQGSVRVRPGVYLLSRDGIDVPDPEQFDVPPGVGLRAFHVPEPRPTAPVVTHEPPAYVERARDLTLTATVTSDEVPDEVLLFLRRPGWRGFTRLEMHPVHVYGYGGRIEGASLGEGPLEYFITVVSGDTALTFPGPLTQRPDQWDFGGNGGWHLRAVDPSLPVVLFRGRDNSRNIVYPHQERGTAYQAAFVSGSTSADAALRIRAEGLPRPPHQLAIEVLVDAPPPEFLTNRDTLSLRIRAATSETEHIAVILRMTDGSGWQGSISLDPVWSTVHLPLSDLTPGAPVSLPRSYPFFLPYRTRAYREGDQPPLSLERLQSIQIELDASAEGARRDAPIGFEVEEIVLR